MTTMVTTASVQRFAAPTADPDPPIFAALCQRYGRPEVVGQWVLPDTGEPLPTLTPREIAS